MLHKRLLITYIDNEEDFLDEDINVFELDGLDIFRDEKISLDMLDFKRPGNSGISCSEGFFILGKKALEHIEKGTFIQKNMIE